MCNPTDIICQGVASVAKGAFEQIAESAASAAGQMIVDSLTWWIRTPSVDPQTPAVATAQTYTLPLIALVLMGSVLVQAMRMTLSRKRDPMLNVGTGLVRYFVVATLGLVVLAGALKAADDFSKKPPGNQLSYCGYFLVFVPIAIKVFGLVKGQLEFSDNIAIGMLILGVACLVAGGGFNTFFAHKLATSLEVEARILRQEATETARERRGLLLRLMGRE